MVDRIRRAFQQTRTIMSNPTCKSDGRGTPRGAGRAFTLVEVLVVMSIVALLVAILLPAIESAREQAKRVVCASNMRQMYICQETYAGDSREYYPGILG